MLGLKIVRWVDGEVCFRFAPPALMREAASGVVHGSILATVLDIAAGFAVSSRNGRDFVTLDLRTDFLVPVVAEVLQAEGSVVRAGSRFGVGDGDGDGDGRIVETRTGGCSRSRAGRAPGGRRPRCRTRGRCSD